ncbi:hypothetical protein B0A48_00741 [Cryoendolithus antarcticus]|uniref:Uncharacterized protein n=1 Tax=Cryoendolithus antarcticus TaxID=1507870 RepID=A0A1V8TR42_9PEZI|nr:hypothetical protein B0A48_00741 [Cryoendolithus antarcticus]
MATSLNPDELRFPEYDLGMPAEVVYDGQHDLPSLSPLADVPFLASSAQNPNIDPHLADNIINTYHHQLNSTSKSSPTPHALAKSAAAKPSPTPASPHSHQ